MKKPLLFGSLITLVFFFSYCSKSSSTPAPAPNLYPIVGLWIGTSQIDGQPSLKPAFYSFDLRKDSSILVQGQSGIDGITYYASGKWSLSGTTFSANVTILNLGSAGVVQTIAATYDSTAGSLKSGTWQNNSGAVTGTFSLLRVN